MFKLTLLKLIRVLQDDDKVKWAATRENLSSGSPTKRDSNQSPQLQRLSRNLNFRS